MSSETYVKDDGSTPPNRLDRIGLRATIALIASLALLVAIIVYGVIDNSPWLPWLLALAIVVSALLAVFLFDLRRPKNVTWRALRQQFGQRFGEIPDRRNFSTGRGKIGDYLYFGIRCFGSKDGLEIGRLMTLVNPPIYIPWAAIAKIDTFPSLLTGHKGFESDMEAQISLRDRPEITIAVPWLAEYRQLLPKSVKFRAIKLSKK